MVLVPTNTPITQTKNWTRPQRKYQQVKQWYDFPDVYLYIWDNICDMIVEPFQTILGLF